jgi:hypothetical protein
MRSKQNAFSTYLGILQNSMIQGLYYLRINLGDGLQPIERMNYCNKNAGIIY